MQEINELKNQLLQEKYGEIWVRTDPPDFVYEEHEHPVDTIYVVMEGSMVTKTNGQTKELKSGDRWLVKKHILHGSIIGPTGCTYLTGVRI